MLLAMVITVALIFLALSGMPIFAVIAATALVGFYLSDIEVTVVAIELYRIVDTPMLVALPLFTLAGYLLAESNASQRLVRTAQAAIGWLPGGLGVIALVACAFFYGVYRCIGGDHCRYRRAVISRAGQGWLLRQI